MNLVTVYRSFSIAEAQLVRSRLEAAEMHPIVANEYAAVAMDGYSQAVGGVLVQVPEDEAEGARVLITDGQNPPA